MKRGLRPSFAERKRSISELLRYSEMDDRLFPYCVLLLWPGLEGPVRLGVENQAAGTGCQGEEWRRRRLRELWSCSARFKQGGLRGMGSKCPTGATLARHLWCLLAA